MSQYIMFATKSEVTLVILKNNNEDNYHNGGYLYLF